MDAPEKTYSCPRCRGEGYVKKLGWSRLYQMLCLACLDVTAAYHGDDAEGAWITSVFLGLAMLGLGALCLSSGRIKTGLFFIAPEVISALLLINWGLKTWYRSLSKRVK